MNLTLELICWQLAVPVVEWVKTNLVFFSFLFLLGFFFGGGGSVGFWRFFKKKLLLYKNRIAFCNAGVMVTKQIH